MQANKTLVENIQWLIEYYKKEITNVANNKGLYNNAQYEIDYYIENFIIALKEALEISKK